MKAMRADCCGKNRKPAQVENYDGYDHSGLRCKNGCGCKKPLAQNLERKSVSKLNRV